MAQPTLAILFAQTAGLDEGTITPTVTNPPASPVTLVSISSISSESSNTTQMLDTKYNLPAFIKAGYLTIGKDIIPLGRKTFFQLYYTYSDGTIVSSNTLLLTNKAVPNTPVLSHNISIRPEDAGVSINIGSMYQKLSVTDGYSPITKIIVYISKVGGLLDSDLTMREVPLDPTVESYDTWKFVSGPALTNAIEYEIAFKVVNSVGASALSNTLVFTPQDTPAQVSKPVVFSLLSDQKRKSQLLNDNNGDIVMYFSKPADYNNLINNLRRVTKMIVYEQEYNTTANGEVPVGPLNQQELTIPQHSIGTNSGALFELPTPEVISGTSYEYKYSILGSPERLGKHFKYSVAAFNINGSGPVSELSDICHSFKLPELQTFSAKHESVTTNLTATPLTTYNGKMSLELLGLSQINGGQDYLLPNANSTLPRPIYDVQLKLEVLKESDQSVVFSSKFVRFIQSVTSVITPAVPGVSAAFTTYTGTGIYNYDFSAVDDIASLNDLLVLGNKYRFKLYRASKDPVISLNEFISSSNDIARTKFESPAPVTKIQTYAVNDDLTTVSSLASPAIRLVFNQLTPAEMGGMSGFNSLIEYQAFQQSLPAANVDKIVHNSSITGSREFLIPQQNLGTQVNNYIRTTIFNSEILASISSLESSPAVQELAFIGPPAITVAAVSKLSSTSISVAITKQSSSTTALGGSTTPFIQNRIVLFKDNVDTRVDEQVILWSAATQSHVFTGLVTGSTYILFIIAERLYTKATHDNIATKRFDNAIIRSNYFTQNFVMNGTPSVPRNIELIPFDKKLSVMYDEPATLNGIAPENVKYHFFLNTDSTNFPTSNVSVADVSGSSEITLTKAFRAKASATDRTNLLDMQNDILHNFSMRAIGQIGGNSLTKISYNIISSTGYVLGAVHNAGLNLISAATVPLVSVNGDMSPATTTMLGEGALAPTSVQVLAQDSKLQLILDKNDTGSVSDLYITIDSNDGIDNSSVGILAFDTRLLRTQASSSGLFNLETYLASPSSVAPGPDAAAMILKYSFSKSIVGAVTKYNIMFSNLINGKIYTVNVRNIRLLGTDDIFSTPIVILRAPEAPPTVVRSIKFDVESQKINTSWLVPANSGGAGVGDNGLLSYRLLLYNSTNTVLQTIDTVATNYSFTGLLNGNDYKITIAALYIKASDLSNVVGPFSQVNTLTGNVNNLIRPNPAPIGSVLTVSGGDNSILASVITAPSAEQSLYPLSRMEFYIRQKATPTLRTLITSANGPFSGSNTVSMGSTVLSGSQITDLGGHQKLLNGFLYEVEVVSIPNYFYAQPPPSKILDIAPMGPLKLISAVVISGTNNKSYKVTANLNGSGTINNIIGLAKGSNSPSILVSNLSTSLANLPVITISGGLDNSTLFLAANQISSFDLSFLAANGPVNDLLVVVASQNSSDTLIEPASAGFFN
jgi:hypothetical protein